MTYDLHSKLEWHEPLHVLAALEDSTHCAMLYSGSIQQNTGRYSYLAWQPAYVHCPANFQDLPLCDETLIPDLPQWIGYLSYGMRHHTESGLSKSEKSPISMPDSVFVQYYHLLRFDHFDRTMEYYLKCGESPTTLALLPRESHSLPEPALQSLHSNMSKSVYVQSVIRTTHAIENGDFYQANITRKFFGEYDHPLNPRTLFMNLCARSPAPYSALMVMGSHAIISSSPEGFVAVDAHGTIQTHPIKGSMPRSIDPQRDAEALRQLATSSKNHAENLMIVDLMRNDLARICTPSSVAVTKLAKLYSYTTIHHLISTITGNLNTQTNHGALLQATFPPGSMTGAPKIAAMNWCAREEPQERGAYSGVIGWLGARKTCDFSVLIRTIITHENRFEFQVGGGIVADSDPHEEWRETLAKAHAMADALGVSTAALEAL